MVSQGPTVVSRRTSAFLWVLVVAAWVGPLGAQTAYLVKNINTTDDLGASLDPRSAVAVGSRIFFLGEDEASGRELWVTDGTSSGTRLVKDLLKGTQGFPNLANLNLTDVNGTLFFSWDRELYKSDGTAEGTVSLGRLGDLTNLTNVNGVLYFAVLEPAALWRSDGTPEGTKLVKSIRATHLTSVAGLLLFAGDDPTTGPELWRSDGSEQGTQLVREICPGPCGSIGPFVSFVALGNRAFFVADDGRTGGELWISDGSADGTNLVLDIVPGGESSDIFDLETVGSSLFFAARDQPGAARTLWRSDGAGANTQRVSSVEPQNLTNVAGLLYFIGNDSGSGRELWTSDGTSQGTRLVKDLCPGPCGGVGSLPIDQPLPAANRLVYFPGVEATTFGPKPLWRSDGSEQGTYILGERLDPGEFAGNGARMYFAASDPASGRELWRTDGTTLGTVIVFDYRRAGSSSPDGLTPVQNKIYFGALEPATGREIWSSDGSPDGTLLSADVSSGPYGSVEFEFNRARTAFQGALLFAAARLVPAVSFTSGLWRTDGTEEGTFQLGTAMPDLPGLEVVGEVAYYASGSGLFRTDGTPPGTGLMSQFSTRLRELTNVDGVLYFASDDALLRLDGSPQGWRLLTPAYVQSLLSFGGKLYFREASGLWESDGTTEGTRPVREGLGTVAGYEKLVRVGGRFFFVSTSGVGGDPYLWRSDGTAAGTVQVTRMLATGLTDGQGLLFFVEPDSAPTYPPFYGRRLWKSDGTAAGTVLVKDLEAISDLTNVDGTLYFAAYDPEHGRELWKSDGTAEGTVLVQDISPGPASSNPHGFSRAGDLVYFSADDGATGDELWAFPVQPSAIAYMSTPAPGSALTSTSVTFSWTPASAALEYWLSVGNTLGGSQIYGGSQGRNLSRMVTGLPGDGRKLYVRVWTLFGGSWRFVDYTYTASVPRTAGLVSPVPGTTLESVTTTFTWEGGVGVAAYWLEVGTTPGGAQIYKGSQVTSLAATVGGLPTNGSTVYLRLSSLMAGTWRYNDYSYTSVTAHTAEMITPPPGTILSSSSVTFTWDAGAGVSFYWLEVGTTLGARDISLGSQTTSRSATVSGLPTNGSGVYVRLWSRMSSTWLYRDYLYTAYSAVTTKAQMLTPTPGSTLTGSAATFTWDAGGGVAAYWLEVGSTPGGIQIYKGSRVTSRSAVVTGIPTNGTPVYVRLWSEISGVWSYNAYTYTAATSATIVLSVSATNVTPGSQVQVTVQGGPGNPRDWVALHLASASDSSYLDWKYLNGSRTPPATGLTSATVTFTMPMTLGTYQFRFFSNNTMTRLASSVNVTVQNSLPTITASTTTATPGQVVHVTVQNGPGSPTDWISLAATGAPESGYLSWSYLNGSRTPPTTGLTSATLTFTMPSPPGTYEFRLFQNNTYTRLATSLTVTVQ